MQILPIYITAVVGGLGFASGIKRGLSHIPLTRPLKDLIILLIIWFSFLFYFVRLPSLTIDPPNLDNSEAGLWLVYVGLPWLMCGLGFPLLVSRIWAAVLASLRDSAIQWILTILAAILSFVAFTIAQGVADFIIHGLIQTHPNQLPVAQRALTLIVAIYFWIGVFYIISIIALFWVPVAETRLSKKPIFGVSAALPIIAAIYFVPLSTALAFRHAEGGDTQADRVRRSTLEEDLVLWTSFMPNHSSKGTRRGDDGNFVPSSRLACNNLPDNVFVAFVHPDEVIPDKVIVAEPRNGDIVDRAQAFNYRLARCENSNNPHKVN